MYVGEEFGNWIQIDNDPERTDDYLVAWLPKGSEMRECFIGLATWYSDGWDEDDLKHISDVAYDHPEVEIKAWMPLPERYKI